MSAVEEAARAVAVTSCREWCDDKTDRCNAPAEFVLWGKLFPRDALGPRCYDHAAKWAGHRALGDPSWAIIDLRPLLRLLDSDPSKCGSSDRAEALTAEPSPDPPAGEESP